MSIPDLDKIVKMSALFGVSTDYLLKDEMEEILPAEITEDNEPSLRMVSMEEADAYMNLVRETSPKFATAISALVLSPIPVLLLGGVAETWPGKFSEDICVGIGITALLVIVIAAVIPIILNCMKLSKYEYLEKEEISLLYGVKGVVEKRKEEFEDTFRKAIAIGTGLCIFAVIPLFLETVFGESDMLDACMVSLLLAFVSGGVFLFVSRGLIHESFTKLLQEGDFTPDKKAKGKIIEIIAGIYWCLVTAIFLACAFITGKWMNCGLIWPVAGVLFAAIVCAAHLYRGKSKTS